MFVIVNSFGFFLIKDAPNINKNSFYLNKRDSLLNHKNL